MNRISTFALVISFAYTGCYDLPDSPPSFSGTHTHDTDSAMDWAQDSVGDTDIASGWATDTGVDTVTPDSATLSDTDTRTDADSDSVASEDTGTESYAAVGTDILSDADTDADTDNSPLPTCADGLLCYDPPRECDGDYNIKLFEPGTCVDGERGAECHYEPSGSEPCESGICREGVCLDHPCQRAVCDNPPEAECLGDDYINLQIWPGSPGVCDENISGTDKCDYELTEFECQYGCVSADEGSFTSCIGDACSGVACALKPADYCDGSRIVSFNDGGEPTPNGGSCVCEFKSKSSINCPSGCDKGRCKDSER